MYSQKRTIFFLGKIALIIMIVMSFTVVVTHLYIASVCKPVDPQWSGNWIDESLIDKHESFYIYFSNINRKVKYIIDIQSLQIKEEPDMDYDLYIILVRVHRDSNVQDIIETYSRVNITLSATDASEEKGIPYAFVDEWFPDQKAYDLYVESGDLYLYFTENDSLKINFSFNLVYTYVSVDTGEGYISWNNVQTNLGTMFMTSVIGAGGDTCWIAKFIVPDASYDGSPENATLAGILNVTMTLEATILYSAYLIKNTTTISVPINLYDLGGNCSC